MAKRQGRFDSGDRWDDPEVFFDGPPAEPAPPILIPQQNLNLNSHTAMEYWEITKDRAVKTLPVWQTHTPALKIRGQGPVELEAFIDGFEPLVQARVEAQDAEDAAFRAVQASLLKMKLMGVSLPKMIQIQHKANEGIRKDVGDLYKAQPTSEGGILKRARMLLPVWERANAALLAMTPPQDAIALNIQGVAHTPAMLEALLDGYTGLSKTLEQKSSLLDEARGALRSHDHLCDELNKDWYAYAKAGADTNQALLDALETIPKEPGTQPPPVVEIEHVTQGGEEGRQALISYPAGSTIGNATTALVQYTLPGDPEPFTRSVPLDLSGNALGPEAVGTLLTLRTRTENSAGARTSAPRTITIQEPIV